MTIFPIISKVDNIGFGENSTNCNVYNRFKINFDIGQKRDFNFPEILTINNVIIQQIVSFYGLKARLKSKIISLFNKLR